jgi:hypothetical protein
MRKRDSCDTAGVSPLTEALTTELERPRELSPRVLNYISGTYDIDNSAIGLFLIERLPGLEDYEIDLILSPVFTPRLSDQAVFAELLGSESVPRDQWPDLIQQLAGRPIRAHLLTADGHAHRIPLRTVTLERYVHRLRLEGTIPKTVLELIHRIEPASEHPVLKAVARRAIWETAGRGKILSRYFTSATARAIYGVSDVLALLDMVESHKPADVAELLAGIPARKEVLRAQISNSGTGKMFFNPRVQEMHGGDRDQRRQDDSGVSAKQNEIAFLSRLEQVLRL